MHPDRQPYREVNRRPVPVERMADCHLGRLQETHCQLLMSVERMLVLVSSSAFNADAYHLARVRLMEATAASRRVGGNILEYFLPRVETREAEALKALQGRSIEMFNRLARHFEQWTPEAVGSNWLAYGPQAYTLCSSMLREVDREQAILYPLLKRQIRDDQ
jgi:hypothetical protein